MPQYFLLFLSEKPDRLKNGSKFTGDLFARKAFSVKIRVFFSTVLLFKLKLHSFNIILFNICYNLKYPWYLFQRGHRSSASHQIQIFPPCWSRFGFVGSGSVCIKSCKQTQSFFSLSSPFCSFSQLQTPQSSSAAAPGQAPPEPPSLLVQTSCSISKHFPPGQTMDFLQVSQGGGQALTAVQSVKREVWSVWVCWEQTPG